VHKKQAFELSDAADYQHAMPLLEDLAKQLPDDAEVAGRYGMAVLGNSFALEDAAKRRTERVRAHAIAVDATRRGLKGSMLDLLLDLPADGGPDASFGDQAITNLMARAEAAAVQGKQDDAIKLYQQALMLNPKLYEAPLFIGDAYFAQKQPDLAGVWYAKAIAIDPDRDTAYRFWCDVLTRNKKFDEARKECIEGIVADPYSPATWQFLNSWAKQAHFQTRRLVLAKLQPFQQKGDHVEIVHDFIASGGGADAYPEYVRVRNEWVDKKFSSSLPAEKQYRHSLQEETEAIGAMLDKAETAVGGNTEKLRFDLLLLSSFRTIGVLKAHILIDRADAGISKDYLEYRKTHREELRNYVDQFLIAEEK
jgi:tetratricopeptide (TPR) repeat protein